MEITEISIPVGIIQQIYPEGPFADIAVDVGNRDHIYPDVNLDVSYEDTLEDIEKTMGYFPVSMRSLPKRGLIHNWSSWKMIEEMNLERARYLLNTDELFEEMLNKTQG